MNKKFNYYKHRISYLTGTCYNFEMKEFFFIVFASRRYASISWAFLLNLLINQQILNRAYEKTYQFTTPCKSDQVTHPKQHKSFCQRQAMLVRVFAIVTCLSVRLSVRLSIRLSVTRRYCVKMKKAARHDFFTVW